MIEPGESRLSRFFTPRSEALVGLSADARAPLARPLHALRRYGYPGRIYPVNARHQTIGELPCYASLADLPECPDAAWIAVPADRVLPVLSGAIPVDVLIVMADPA